MGKSTFSTACGGCASIIITLLILYYLAVLILELVIHSEAYSLTTVDYVAIAPEYNIKMDKYGIFPGTNVTQYLNTQQNETTMQISIGIMDQRTMSFRPIDPRYFNIHMFTREQVTAGGVSNLTSPYVFFDLCKRFRDFDGDFVKWNLDKTYCIYSDLRVQGVSTDKNFSYLNIDINRCTNDSLYYVDKEETEGYKTTYGNMTLSNYNTSLYNLLNLSIFSNISNSNIPTTSSSSVPPSQLPNLSAFFGGARNLEESEERNTSICQNSKTNFFEFIENKIEDVKSKKRNLEIGYFTSSTMTWSSQDFTLLNPRTELISKAPNNSVLLDVNNAHLVSSLYAKNDTLNGKVKYNKVVCAPIDLVNEVVNNMQIYLFFTNAKINITDYENPIKLYFDYQDFFTSYLMKKTKSFEFSNQRLVTFDSAFPQFLDKSNITNYAFTIFDFGNTVSDLADGNLYRAMFYSSNKVFNTERKYSNILDIMGLVGGLSKILLTIGSLVTLYIMNVKLNESMINEFYSVIDPTNTENVNLNFEGFIFKMAKYYEISADIETIPGEFDNISKVIKTFYNHNLIKKLYNNLLAAKKKGFDERENNDADQIDDKQKAVYEIIYEIFKYRAYDKMYFTSWELFQKSICCCYLSDYFRKKDKIFKEACKKLENDTDFPELLKAVREFQRINKTFLDDGQYHLFNSMVNKTITIQKILKKKNRDKEEFEDLKRSTTEQIKNNASDNKLNNLERQKTNQEVEMGKIDLDRIITNNKIAIKTKKVDSKNNKIELLKEEELNDLTNINTLNKALTKIMTTDRVDKTLDSNLLENVQVSKKLIDELFYEKPKAVDVKENVKEESELLTQQDKFNEEDYNALKEKFNM